MKVHLVMAQTLDGRIARSSDELIDWTEASDKKFFRKITKEKKCMIMGRKTFETLPGVLPGRKTVVMGRSFGEWEELSAELIKTKKSPEKNS